MLRYGKQKETELSVVYDFPSGSKQSFLRHLFDRQSGRAGSRVSMKVSGEAMRCKDVFGHQPRGCTRKFLGVHIEGTHKVLY